MSLSLYLHNNQVVIPHTMMVFTQRPSHFLWIEGIAENET